MDFEYKTVGGPERGRKRKGCKTAADRVAAAMEELIQAEAAEGWEYLRTDLVPVEERSGLFARRQTMHCAVLVFRRPRGAVSDRKALSRKAAAIFNGEAPARRSAAAEPRLAPASAPTPAPMMAPPPQHTPHQAAQQTTVAAAPTPQQLNAAVIAAHPYSLDGSGIASQPAPDPAPGHVPPAPEAAPPTEFSKPGPGGLFTRMPGPPKD
ncbi:MAG: hypothetical protein AAFU49_06120 [Pseudomonadota bacterium]